MLILLALVVVALAGLLWWMRDRYTYTAGGTRETYASEIPTEDEMIAVAYGALPENLQEDTKNTEIVTPATIEANYMEVAQQHQEAIRREETVVQQYLEDSSRIDPTMPIDQQIARVNTDPAVLAVAAAEERQTQQNDFQQLLATTDAAAKDTCFGTYCAAVQSDVQQKCAEFQSRCFYTNNYDVQRCLATANSGCSTARVDTCRASCGQLVDGIHRKSILKQGDVLSSNQRLQSVSGSTIMILRDNGNLELYYNSELIWSSRTTASGGASTMNQNPYKLMIYPNGDMAIKNALNIEVWHTNTWMNAFDAGTENGPYQCIVAEKMIALLNRNGKILWNSNAT